MNKDKQVKTTSLPSKLKLLVLSTDDWTSTASSINSKNELLLTIHKPCAESYIYNDGKATLIPVKSGNLCYASSINDHSEVVGGFGPEFHQMNAYHYKNGKMTILPSLGGGTTGATGINNEGLIVGLSWKGGRQRAVIWKNGNVIDLGPKLPGESAFYAINNNGTGVGYFREKDKIDTFLYKDGSITILKNQDECSGTALNNHNYIAGHLQTKSARRAFLYKNKQFFFPNIKGSVSSNANDINDNNIIAGYSMDRSGKRYGFLWKDEKVININSIIKSDYTVVNVQAINDNNFIVGQCAIGKQLRACLLVPEA